jgi:hypothetical protein
MKGAWTEEEGTATITWATSWYTKISKDGDGYKKSAYKGSLSSQPMSTSPAVKVD